MLLSILLNSNIGHLIEIFGWMLGAFLIGLFFGHFIERKKNTNIQYHIGEYDDLNIKENTSKIRATKTFERGGKEMAKTVLTDTLTSLDFDRIGVGSLETKNELQKIKGIGPSIEQKLNNIGIYTFQQISNFNNEDIQKITQLTKLFPDRIKRDDWIKQACNLATKTKNN